VDKRAVKRAETAEFVTFNACTNGEKVILLQRENNGNTNLFKKNLLP
jgi:hypothetical protein